MVTQLQSVQIERFKAIRDAPFDLGPVNVLVGANNSGKSSIIQGMHFGVGLLQIIRLAAGTWTSGDSISTSLNPIQLIYSPSEDVYSLAMGGKLLESQDASIKISFTLDSGERPTVAVRKGRNRNILVSVTNARAAKQLASLEQPFSVFSPGLAGIAKTEQYLSDGVLLRTIARGDANLVLRNILLRLWGAQPLWEAFLSDLQELFPELRFRVQFNQETDEFITVQATIGGEWIPLELVGTGVLQATQILSYIHRFSPSIVVLDEPDSHLHPNNQRLLCGLLRKVAEERNTQILLTTHSRHVVDAIGASARFLWVRNGTVETAGPDDEIGILLDIGALDVKERVAQEGTRLIVLTEDETPRLLTALVMSSGCIASETLIVPYYGVSTIKQLRPLVKMISATNPRAKIVVHRDRDYMADDEVEEWERSVRQLGVEPFVTTGTDIESHFLNSNHLAALNTVMSNTEFEQLIEIARAATRDESVQHYVNGRLNIARAKGTHATINHGKLAIEAPKAVDGNIVRWGHGKTVLKRLRAEFQARAKSSLRIDVPSDAIADPSLMTVAKKTFVSRST